MSSDSDRAKDQVCYHNDCFRVSYRNFLFLIQDHVFKLIKDIQFAMLTTTDDDGSLRARPMAYKQGDSDSKTELWYIRYLIDIRVPL